MFYFPQCTNGEYLAEQFKMWSWVEGKEKGTSLLEATTRMLQLSSDWGNYELCWLVLSCSSAGLVDGRTIYARVCFLVVNFSAQTYKGVLQGFKYLLPQILSAGKSSLYH